MKQKWKWTALVLAVVLVGFGTALFLWPRDRITEESWNKIRIGMTEKEVEEILGCPGMDQEDFIAEWEQLRKKIGSIQFEGKSVSKDWIVGTGPESEKMKVWLGERRLLEIQLDQGGHVISKAFWLVRSGEAAFIDRLRDWLGW